MSNFQRPTKKIQEPIVLSQLWFFKTILLELFSLIFISSLRVLYSVFKSYSHSPPPPTYHRSTPLLPTSPTLCLLILQDQFGVAQYSWVYVLPLESGLLTRSYTIRENCLSFQQLTTANSCISTGGTNSFMCPTLPCWDFVWLGFALLLCLLPQLLCILVCNCPAVSRICCPVVICHLWLLHFFWRPFQ